MKRLALPLTSLALLSAVVGCNDIDSADIETSGINASITVRAKADGSSTNVSASLTAGALTFVDLDGEDQLVASAGEASVVLAEADLLGVVGYSGTLDGVGAPDEEVTVALERSEDKEPAPNSLVRIPEPIAIAAPAAGTAFSRADDDIVVDLTSEESADDARLLWRGDCVKNGSLDVPAGQSSITINKATIEKREQVDENDPDSEPVPDTCTLTIEIERLVAGTLDPAWGSGNIRAIASDSRDLTTNP